jgi:mannose-6-phosphate isomerase-like protein (cupin superfamily)
MSNYKEDRPWGSFENLLDSNYCKVKEIIIKKGGRPSYQYHHKRSEVWTIVQGEAVVTLDGEERVYVAGEVVKVPVGVAHRVENKQDEDLKFIEVQTGTYFGEDDIVRLEDDYGREGTNS